MKTGEPGWSKRSNPPSVPLIWRTLEMKGDYTCFTFEVDEKNIARVHFARPDLHNRFDEPMHSEFAQLLLDVWKREDIRALILSAEGRSWSAGGDLNMMVRQNGDKTMRDRLTWEAKVIFDVFVALPFPVIAAVHGAAIGLGATIATLSDIVVAAADAKFADPHVDLGLVAGDGGIIGWAQSIGVTRAKRFLFTGERISGRKAYEIGLVSDLVESPEEVYPAARAIAENIAAKPRCGVIGTKRAFTRLTRVLADPVFELGLAYEMEAMGGPEVLAAVKAAQQEMASRSR
jgi:enoyl-CoA hydratase